MGDRVCVTGKRRSRFINQRFPLVAIRGTPVNPSDGCLSVEEAILEDGLLAPIANVRPVRCLWCTNDLWVCHPHARLRSRCALAQLSCSVVERSFPCKPEPNQSELLTSVFSEATETNPEKDISPAASKWMVAAATLKSYLRVFASRYLERFQE
jgi:hypothetical protein